MADLTLTGQATSATQIKTSTNQLESAMNLRKDVWARMPLEKRMAWIKSGKDPVMTLAWEFYIYLRDNFFRGVDNG